MVAAAKGRWGVDCGDGRAFLVLSAHPQLTLRSVDFRSMNPKMCFFCGWCDALGVSFPRRLNLPILPTKSFSIGQLRLHV